MSAAVSLAPPPAPAAAGVGARGEPLFPPDEIAWLLVEAGSLLRRAGRSTTAGLGDVHAIEPIFARLATDPRLIACAAALCGGPARLMGTWLGPSASAPTVGTPPGAVVLLVELGGASASRVGRVRTAGHGPLDLGVVLLATFRCALPPDIPTQPAPRADLWPTPFACFG
jgi:hypothetical protein